MVGSLGYGAFLQGHWFSGSWSTVQATLSIAYKELFPVVVAAYLWGALWVSKQVKLLCNNEAAMAVLKSGTSRDPNLMVLLHYLSLLTECHSFSFSPQKSQPCS